MTQRRFCTVVNFVGGAALLLLASMPVRADWSDWWSTPEQKARSAFKAGEFDQLKSIAPDQAWQGVAQHKSEEYEAAAKTFADTATQQRAMGNTKEANRALYNQGVSEVRAGQYENAVQSFDQLLEQDPEFTDARHNRDIAQQLIQQQEQQQQSQDGDGGDSSSEEGEQQQSDPSGEQSEDQQNSEQSDSEQSDSDEQTGEQSDNAEGQSGDNSDASQSESEAQQAQDEQAARDALEAEAQQQAAEEQAETEAHNATAQQSEQPLSESEQATEQWLRRIPDDPAGLLRRKLEQSHRTEFPEVRDAREPW